MKERSPRLIAVSPIADIAGGETALLRLLPELIDRGWDVRMTVPAPGRLRDAAEELGLKTLWLPLGPPERRTAASYFGGVFAARLARADVVFLNGLPAQRTVPALRAVNVPAVVRVNNPLPDAPTAWGRTHFWEVVSLVIADSEHTGEECRAAGAPEDRVEVAYPAAWSGDQPAGSSVGDGMRVGFVGRLEERKGLGVLIEAAARFLAERPAARLTIIGEAHPHTDPGYADRLRELVEASPVADRIELTGWAPDGIEAIAGLDVLCVPSLAEPFGTVSAEAAAVGVPVVASRVGGLAEVVLDGETGVLVPPGDARALADAVGALLDDPARRAEYARRARERAASFAPAAYAERMDALLRGVVAAGDRG